MEIKHFTDIFFKLEIILYDGKRCYPRFKVYRRDFAFFHTHKEAEFAITEYLHTKDKEERVYCFYIHELPFNQPLWAPDSQHTWVYLEDGTLFTESLVSTLDYNCELEYFWGRPAELIKFKKRDLVEVLRRNEVNLEIVASTPPTPEKIIHLNKKHREHGFPGDVILSDYSDDCYRTLYTDGDHEHPQNIDLFPPRNKISNQLRQKLYQVFDTEE